LAENLKSQSAVVSLDGVLYFGAAKNLPEAKQDQGKGLPKAPELNKKELEKILDDAYLGRREKSAEELSREREVEELLRAAYPSDGRNMSE